MRTTTMKVWRMIQKGRQYQLPGQISGLLGEVEGAVERVGDVVGGGDKISNEL